ncbi:GNAT family N-acetyltransferase [Porticoccaceae bacterium]|nr:GNAT family N-acetyltransferase [Porticoccaceae bacterium]
MDIKIAATDDAQYLSDFHLMNFEHFKVWEPLREEDYHSIEAWRQRLEQRKKEQELGIAAYFILYSREANTIIGTCSLTNITKGPFQACNIGYAISLPYEGMGYMKKLCSYVIRYAFEDIGLNRIMANYIPHNSRSEGLLKSLGFVEEGYAQKYLRINGKWENHVLTALVNPKNR